MPDIYTSKLFKIARPDCSIMATTEKTTDLRLVYVIK